ncbi:MAG: carboxymuconolactone decarboxylase [Candidatus Eremiobacteraeota bacterium]|jgi:3-oxoadipate enol-lactonase|nr:carboxymuconolactone decarboxylase [Candidatus Eremiobacteraeota bacterium]
MSADEALEIRRVALSDHETEIAIAGRGDRTLMLLHAVGLSWRMWREAMLALPPGTRAVACDLRGHGVAATTPPTTLDRHADDVRDLLDTLGLPRADVVGLSYGGAVAEHVALRHPERVASLGLVATFSRARPEIFLDRARVAETVGIGAQIGETLTRWFSPAELEENGAAVRWVRERLNANRVENWAGAWRALAGLDVHDLLGTIRVPATVVAGAHDTSATAEMMRGIADALPDATFDVIAEGHHMLSLEQPEQLARLLAANAGRA